MLSSHRVPTPHAPLQGVVGWGRSVGVVVSTMVTFGGSGRSGRLTMTRGRCPWVSPPQAAKRMAHSARISLFTIFPSLPRFLRGVNWLCPWCSLSYTTVVQDGRVEGAD